MSDNIDWNDQGISHLAAHERESFSHESLVSGARTHAGVSKGEIDADDDGTVWLHTPEGSAYIVGHVSTRTAVHSIVAAASGQERTDDHKRAAMLAVTDTDEIVARDARMEHADAVAHAASQAHQGQIDELRTQVSGLDAKLNAILTALSRAPVATRIEEAKLPLAPESNDVTSH